MLNRFRNLFFVFIIAFCSLYFFSCGQKDKNNDDTVNQNPAPPDEPDPTIIPKFINTNHIELDKISRISKFRSAAGHDYSDDYEHCRNMKHYYASYDSLDWSTIKIFSPINGTVSTIFDEWAGTQVQINSDQHKNFTVIIFHVILLKPLKVGDKLVAGQQLGTHYGSQTSSDIAVFQTIPNHPNYDLRKMISYFDLMTDSLFQKYQQRGITSRSDLIITKEERDANPLTCNAGGFFTPSENEADWVILK